MNNDTVIGHMCKGYRFDLVMNTVLQCNNQIQYKDL